MNLNLFDLKLSPEETENILSSFWTMLRECEERAYEQEDHVLKVWVNQWYQQWNQVTGANVKPRWVVEEVANAN